MLAPGNVSADEGIEVRATSRTGPPLAHPFPIQNREFLTFIK